jgi:hypothetical protein
MDAASYTAGIFYLRFVCSVWKHGVLSLITHNDSTYPCDLSLAARDVQLHHGTVKNHGVWGLSVVG